MPRERGAPRAARPLAQPGPRVRQLLLAVTVLLALHSAWFLNVRLRMEPACLTYNMPVWQIVLYTPGPPQPERPFWEVVEFAQWHKCVPILDIADCYNKPWIDYIGTSLGYDDGLRFVQRPQRRLSAAGAAEPTHSEPRRDRFPGRPPKQRIPQPECSGGTGGIRQCYRR